MKVVAAESRTRDICNHSCSWVTSTRRSTSFDPKNATLNQIPPVRGIVPKNTMQESLIGGRPILAAGRKAMTTAPATVEYRNE